MVETYRLEAFIDGLTEDEQEAAERVRRLPGASHADVYLSVEQYRIRKEMCEGFTRLESHMEPAWRTMSKAIGLAVATAITTIAALMSAGQVTPP